MARAVVVKARMVKHFILNEENVNEVSELT